MFEARKQADLARWKSVSLDEISQFIGPKAPSFMRVARGMRSQALGAGKVPRSWCWPALFFPFVWFAYRKMYVLSAIAFAVPIVFALFIKHFNLSSHNGIGVGYNVVCVLSGKQFYIFHTVSKIEAMKKNGSPSDAEIAKAGGVSLLAGFVTGIFFFFILTIPLLPLVLTSHHSLRETAVVSLIETLHLSSSSVHRSTLVSGGA